MEETFILLVQISDIQILTISKINIKIKFIIINYSIIYLIN